MLPVLESRAVRLVDMLRMLFEEKLEYRPAAISQTFRINKMTIVSGIFCQTYSYFSYFHMVMPYCNKLFEVSS